MSTYLKLTRAWTAWLKDESADFLLQQAALFRPLCALLQRTVRMADTREILTKYRESRVETSSCFKGDDQKVAHH